MDRVKNYLSLDVGSTCCKAQVFDENGEILFYRVRECPLKRSGGFVYADIAFITETVKSLVREAARSAAIDSVCFSSFGESFVLLDGNDDVLTDPMLYTDGRGSEQAELACALFGKEKIYSETGVMPHAMYSVYKLLWIMEHEPEIYKAARKLFLIGDYFGYLLTGKRAIDFSLAARTGVFDIKNKVFDRDLIDGFDIPVSLFSQPMPAGSVVGKVTPRAAEEFGLPRDCVLVLGSHDQVCTALGAGVVREGQAVDGMGTVECITAVFKEKSVGTAAGEAGFPIVPFAVEGLYCTYICNYASGSIVKWFKDEILHGYRGEEENTFSYLEKNFTEAPTGIYTLPYFAGSAIPFQNNGAKGAIIGLTTSATDSRLYQSLMEGQAMEMKFETQIAKRYGIGIKSAVATGGGANSEKWLQIKADVQGIHYSTLRSSEGGLCGCAVLQAVAIGKKSYDEAVAVFVKKKKEFAPNKERAAAYAPYYKKYQKLYQKLKEFF